MSLIDARFLARMWKKETPSGTVNGVNTAFTLSETPIENDSVDIYLDGLLQTEGVNYTLSATSITMITVPQLGQELLAKYIQRKGGS